MKHTLPLLALLLTTTAGFAKKNNKLYDNALTYFRSCKPNHAAALSKSLTKQKGDAPTIWEAWRTVVAERNSGNKLPQQTTLSEESKYSWAIPDSLEPDATLNFRYGTKGDCTDRRVPLFIYLHGSGPRQMEWQTGLMICSKFDDAPSAYFIPQIPQEGQWYRWYQKSKQWFLESAILQVFASEQVDPQRVYIFGISEGGYGSQRLASYYADYLAAAGPMAGGEPLKNAPVENCGNIGFSFLTGAQDRGFYRNMLTQITKDAFDSIQVIHPDEYKHRIKLLEGYGHGIDYSLTTPWLKEFKRNPCPTHFIWEDLEVDGLHRSGFYNIAVNSRPDPELRTRYEFSAKDNVIRLTVQDVQYTCTKKDPYWGIELTFSRSYTQSKKGDITIFLNQDLADLNKPVTIYINDKQVYKAKPKASAGAMMQSLATFGDPLRIFPVAINLQVPAAE